MDTCKSDDGGATQSKAFDLSPLDHPVWWLGLGTLLVNDRLLKGAGLVPPWLTGKLSDFAFLLVAPVVFACMLPTRIRYRRFIAFLLVTAVFTAADLSAEASQAMVALARRLGLRWELWPDVTDLLALAMLPIAWRIAGRKSPRVGLGSARLLRPAGLMLGAFACLATSAPPTFVHVPFVANRTGKPQSFGMAWAHATACPDNLVDYSRRITLGDFGPSYAGTLQSMETAALDSPPSASGGIALTCSNRSRPNASRQDCATALVWVTGGPAVLVSTLAQTEESNEQTGSFFSCDPAPDPVSKCSWGRVTGNVADAEELSLALEGNQVAFRAGAKLRILPIDVAEVFARPIPPPTPDAGIDGGRDAVRDVSRERYDVGDTFDGTTLDGE